MRNFLTLLLAMILVVSCNKENVDNKNNVVISGEVVLSVESITEDDVTINATPSEEVTQFVVYPLTKEEYLTDYLFDDEDAANGIIKLLGSQISATANGVTTFDSETVVSLSAIRELKLETEYTFIAFGINQNCAISSEITTLEVTSHEQRDGVAEIAVSEITHNDAKIEVKVEDGWDGNYYIAPLALDVIDTQFNGDPEALLDAIITEERDEYKTDFSQVDGIYIFNGDASFNLLYETNWLVIADTDYYMAAVGVDEYGNKTTEITLSPIFTTASIPDIEIGIETNNITANSVSVSFSPSDDQVDYFYSIVEWDVVKDKSSDEILTNFLNYHGINIEAFITKAANTVEITGLKSGADYLVIACSHDIYTGSTGTMSSTRFVTTGEPAFVLDLPTEITIPDVDFGDIEVYNIGGNSCFFKINRKNKTMRYFPMVAKAEDFNKFDSDEERILNDLAYFKEYGFTVLYTFADILKEVSYGGDTQGSSFADLEPMTDYVMYVFGIDVKTAQPTSKVEKIEFTTGEFNEDESEEAYYTRSPKLYKR